MMGWEMQGELCAGHSSVPNPAPAALLHSMVPFVVWGMVALDVSHILTYPCLGPRALIFGECL